MAHYETIFKNGTVANHDGIHRADIGITAGRIAAIGDLGAASAAETVDCTGLHILPGVSHFAPVQRPEIFNAAILAFLDKTIR